MKCMKKKQKLVFLIFLILIIFFIVIIILYDIYEKNIRLEEDIRKISEFNSTSDYGTRKKIIKNIYILKDKIDKDYKFDLIICMISNSGYLSLLSFFSLCLYEHIDRIIFYNHFSYIIIMVFVIRELVDSIIIFIFRKNKIIPYLKVLDSNKFDSHKTCQKIEGINISLIFIVIINLILLIIILDYETCCKKNRNENQINNQQHQHNENNINNVNNVNQRTEELLVINQNQNANNTINSNRRETRKERENNNNNNNENKFLNKFLKLCNVVNFDKNKFQYIEDCIICSMNFKFGEKIIILPCFHIYHEKCLITWLKDHKTCPLDNQNLEKYI